MRPSSASRRLTPPPPATAERRLRLDPRHVPDLRKPHAFPSAGMPQTWRRSSTGLEPTTALRAVSTENTKPRFDVFFRPEIHLARHSARHSPCQDSHGSCRRLWGTFAALPILPVLSKQFLRPRPADGRTMSSHDPLPRFNASTHDFPGTRAGFTTSTGPVRLSSLSRILFRLLERIPSPPRPRPYLRLCSGTGWTFTPLAARSPPEGLSKTVSRNQASIIGTGDSRLSPLLRRHARIEPLPAAKPARHDQPKRPRLRHPRSATAPLCALAQASPSSTGLPFADAPP